MSGQERDQRTEPATPKRRNEVRQKGQVAMSPDLNAAILLTASLALISILGSEIVQVLTGVLRDMLVLKTPSQLQVESVMTITYAAAERTIPTIALFTLSLAAIGALSSYGQVGFQLTLSSIRWDLSRLNPIKSLSNFFNLRALVRLGLALVKAAIIVTVIYLTVKGELPQIALLDRTDLPGMISFMGSLLSRAALSACLALIGVGIADFFYQRWQFERDLRMTKQEVKDEAKQVEGDPAVKGQIKKKQREVAMRRMMAAVPKATVVVTNPTHYSIALKYKTGEDKAPKVVAKGKDRIALRIREIAKEHNVPIIENPPLAQSLYRTVEVDQEIPHNLYRAVAELLSHVFRLRGKL